jgi:hypothetical protein
MKTKTDITLSVRNFRTLILVGAVAILSASVACSRNTKPSAKLTETVRPNLQQVALKAALPAPPETTPLDVADKTIAAKPSPSKLITYKSRDYGVSFVYPYQYAYLSARVIANGDVSLLPKSDGHDGQFSLARIDIPKGFYPDSDFDRGYFTLSLNPDISEQECMAVLGDEKDKVQSESINGVEFRWIESDEGGRGNASRMRNYVAFTNGSCYELEMGVKTKNEQGLAREVDTDQVLRRLDGIAKSVKILPAAQKTVATQIDSAADAKTEDPKN